MRKTELISRANGLIVLRHKIKILLPNFEEKNGALVLIQTILHQSDHAPKAKMKNEDCEAGR